MTTVLLVEDQEQVRVVLERMLKRLGMNALVAPDAKSAIAVAAQHEGPIHVLLTDVVMPGMSGPSLADVLSTARIGAKTIFMSGYPDEVALRQVNLDENSLLLSKPFGAAELEAAIHRLVNGRAA